MILSEAEKRELSVLDQSRESHYWPFLIWLSLSLQDCETSAIYFGNKKIVLTTN